MNKTSDGIFANSTDLGSNNQPEDFLPDVVDTSVVDTSLADTSVSLNLEDLLKNQSQDIEVLAELFREQHEEHLRQEQGSELNRQISDRLLIRKASQNQVYESLKGLREHVATLEEKAGGGEGDSGHSGTWRCSVMSCGLSQSSHDYSQPFKDGNRHIFFWDCCLGDDKDSPKCDMDFFGCGG
ncbi:hypothetical protein ACHWQZ_G006146 [Mnemiopsis leidyi]